MKRELLCLDESSPRGLPNMTPLLDGFWILNEDYIWSDSITVPKGFITDLDSVPRIPYFHAWLKGRATVAALVHDYLYSIRADRQYADNVFDAAMKWEGVSSSYRRPIYAGVWAFGWSRYKKVTEKPKLLDLLPPNCSDRSLLMVD